MAPNFSGREASAKNTPSKKLRCRSILRSRLSGQSGAKYTPPLTKFVHGESQRSTAEFGVVTGARNITCGGAECVVFRPYAAAPTLIAVLGTGVLLAHGHACVSAELHKRFTEADVTKLFFIEEH